MTEQEAIKAMQELQEQLKAVKPLTPAQIEAMAEQARETDPELQRLDAEIRQLKAIDEHLPGGRKNQRQGKTPEAREVQGTQDAQEVRKPFDCKCRMQGDLLEKSLFVV